MGGTGELGLYGYLGTPQSRTGRVTCWGELGLRRALLRYLTGSGFPAGCQVPKYCRHALTDRARYARTDGKL